MCSCDLVHLAQAGTNGREFVHLAQAGTNGREFKRALGILDRNLACRCCELCCIPPLPRLPRDNQNGLAVVLLGVKLCACSWVHGALYTPSVLYPPPCSPHPRCPLHTDISSIRRVLVVKYYTVPPFHVHVCSILYCYIFIVIWSPLNTKGTKKKSHKAASS
jgi:hypothetical protein